MSKNCFIFVFCFSLSLLFFTPLASAVKVVTCNEGSLLIHEHKSENKKSFYKSYMAVIKYPGAVSHFKIAMDENPQYAQRHVSFQTDEQGHQTMTISDLNYELIHNFFSTTQYGPTLRISDSPKGKGYKGINVKLKYVFSRGSGHQEWGKLADWYFDDCKSDYHSIYGHDDK